MGFVTDVVLIAVGLVLWAFSGPIAEATKTPPVGLVVKILGVLCVVVGVIFLAVDLVFLAAT